MLVDGSVHLAAHMVPKAPSQQGLATVLLMDSRSPNPVFVLQAGLPSSPRAGTGSGCVVESLKKLFQGKDAVVWSPCPRLESAGPVAASTQLMALCPRQPGWRRRMPVPVWKSLPFAGQVTQWLYSDGHLYLIVYLPDPPGRMSSSEVAAVLLRPTEVVVRLWTALLKV